MAAQSTEPSLRPCSSKPLFGGSDLMSARVGPRPQYSTIISVEVGLHHASPPPPKRAYSPWWVSCEYCGTLRSTVRCMVVWLGWYFGVWGAKATAATSRTVGRACAE